MALSIFIYLLGRHYQW